MKTFIFDVLNNLNNKGEDFSSLTFILPSKRAGVFLRQELSTRVEKTIFSPIIISIEEFVEELAELKTITNTELLFEFYNSYLELTPKKERESFESFSKWAQILLQDFNEIDRYLIPQKEIFDYLSAIKKLDHWSLEPEKTEFVSNYLKFWDKLKVYYNHFNVSLIARRSGYQGLVYREAANKIDKYCLENSTKSHIFLGFNALNTAEENIIQHLLENGMAKIFWDIDSSFLENPIHDAALFTRKHKKEWPYFKNNPFNWVTENYSTKKNITLYGVPKNIGQAKTVGSILESITKENPELKSTAVVLGDENLLIPVLNSIPKEIEALNITMGFPLKSIPLASLFELLFTIHKKGQNTFYYKDVISLLSHQFIKPLFKTNDDVNEASVIIEAIKINNVVYLSLSDLEAHNTNKLLKLLFSNWQNNSQHAISNCFNIINEIKVHLTENKSSNLLSLEYLFRFNTLFNELYRLNESYNHISDISALYSIYNELLSSETLDFKGEPLQGLQIMGMLESRVLDFETVILTSVNEGILPSGKSNNSFIPFDVKIENGLPTYKEKDAVYTYHFYRLLQRAKNIYIVYNTEADALTGGEKSRFINQLQLENIHTIKHHIVVPQVPIINLDFKEILKTTSAINKLKELAEYGFSPSSLTSYMRNPLAFYYQKLLGIKDLEDVEETVAANTLGTVVHDTLEALYEPFINRFLTVDNVKKMKSKIEVSITHFFKKQYKDGDMTKGKNLIIFEIAKRYVLNFLNLEIKDLEQGNTIKIMALEQKSEIPIRISQLDFKIKLRGTVDRVDEYNGVTRIIDYKTGKVLLSEVTITNWEAITTDYKKFSKSFQILAYAYMMNAQKTLNFPIEAGIISFKNLSAGVMSFGVKATPYARTRDSQITQETLDNFEKELKKLILEICDPNIPFIEKDV